MLFVLLSCSAYAVTAEEGSQKVNEEPLQSVVNDAVALDVQASEQEEAKTVSSLSTPLSSNSLPEKPSVSSLSNWPIVILMLFGIVCLILILAWFVKRFGGFNMTGGRDMRVLSSVPLGARERVALIDVKGQQFLVGVTTQNINHLHTFDEPVVDTPNENKLGANNYSKSDFAKKLQQILTTKPSSD